MYKSFFKLCSFLLVVVLLFNMLPLNVFAEQLNTDTSKQINTESTSVETETSTDSIIGEIIDKRTEFSKEFLLGSGLHMITLYPEAVHYETEDGWEEIDNTLVAKADGTITNTAGVWGVAFPQQLSKDQSITIQKDGYTLSFFMAGELTDNNLVAKMTSLIKGDETEPFAVGNIQKANASIQMPDLTAMRESVQHEEMVPEKVRSQITYANVYQNTDVIYDLDSNKVKESVVLESYNSSLRGYRYTLDVGEMVPVLDEDGQILLYDAKKENIVMVMPAPYMIDDAGKYNDDVQVQLTGSGSRYTMTYLLPQQWLAEEDRAWPVILDPIVQPALTTTNIRDRSVTEYWVPSQTWGYNACGYFVPEGIVRFFLKYDNLPHLTSSDVIVNATIRMYKDTGTDPTMPVYVHKVLDTWESETITWANMPDYDTTVIEDYAIVQANDWYVWDVTDIARGWYAGENTGMMFKADDSVESSGVGNYKQFISSDYGGNAPPILSITFRNNNGLESYWDYTSASAGRAGTGYVNNYTGNLVWVRDDLGFEGNRMPVNIQHIYNANDAKAIGYFNNSNFTAGNGFGLGNGWRTNYHQRVYQWQINGAHNDCYIWEDADGTDHYFELSSDGTYKDEDGLDLTLTVSGSGDTTYCITDKNGNASYFDYNGRLTKIENNQEIKSSITIEYFTYLEPNDRIAIITDGAGRKYEFSYNSSGLLSTIKYLGTGTTEHSCISFGYGSNQNLTSITDEDGETTTYTYGYNNLLFSAEDIDGYALNYSYRRIETGIPARIWRVEESCKDIYGDGGGASLTFDYQHNQTTITDLNNNQQVMQFNNMGNTVCIQDSEGRAQYSQFSKNDRTEQTGKANQLTLTSKMQNTVGNILNDSSFENGTLWYITANEPSISISTAHAYMGEKSMQVTTSAYASGVHEHTYTLQPGETVTYSAYVKTDTASLSLCVYDWAGVNEGERIMPNTDWTRIESRYTNTTNASKNINPHILTWTPGTFWVDCIQLEFSSTASRYNLVENGDFRHSSSTWSSHSGRTIVNPSAVPQLENTVYAMTGSPTAQKRISQTVQVSGSSGESFVFGGWAQGNAAPLWDKGLEDYTRQFAVILNFNYTNGTQSEPFIAQFNPDSDAWQYVAKAAVAKSNYNSVTVTLAYDYNVNTVYFDGIQLFKETFGTSYTYDDKGNVISTADYANQKSQYQYNGTNLEKLITPTGTEYEYVYDSRNNLVLSRSSEGLQYAFSYDAYGNPVEATIETNRYSKPVREGYYYYIRNRLSGKYLDLNGNSIVQKDFTGADTQKWEIEGNIDGSWSLVNVSNFSFGFLTVSGGASADGTPVHTYYPNLETGDPNFTLMAQTVKILPADKFTYKIVAKAADFESCIEVANDSTAEGAGLVLWEYDGSEAQQWFFEPAEEDPVQTLEDGAAYQFRAYHSGKYISVNNQSSAEGTNLVQYQQESFASQKFTVNRYGDTDYYTLIPQNAPDKLLQISDGVNANGFRYLQIGSATVTDSKLFKFEYQTSMQGFLLIPKANEAYALDVAYYSLNNGADLIFTGKAANSNRVFHAEPISQTITTSATYSADGNLLTSTTDALGQVTTYGHDADTGLLTWVQDPEDTADTRTNYVYDYMERPMAVYSSLNETINPSVTYRYTEDQLTSIHSGSTNYRFTYGDFALRTSVSAGNYTLATYTYSPGRLKWLTALDYGNGDSVEYNYDIKGRVTKETFEDGDTVTYTYNNNGELATVKDSATGITTTYHYDLTDRMVKYRESGGGRDHSVQYTYDERNNLTSKKEIINGTTYTTSYHYDRNNWLCGATTNGISEFYNYDSLGRVTRIATQDETLILDKLYTFTEPYANSGNGQIATNRLWAGGYDVTYSYTYDGNGNILSVSDGTYTTTYVYDTANQLIRENNQAGGFTHTWDYDATGIIHSRYEYPYTTGELGEYTDRVIYTYGDSSWGDLLTAYDGNTITYDGVGNPLSDGTWNYTWEHGRELMGMSNGTTNWTFAYDANGMRTQRSNGSTTYQYLYNGSNLVQMTVGNDTMYFTYGVSGLPVAVTIGETSYYYVTNIQGDVIAILDASENPVVTYSYDAWGNILSTGGSMAATLGTLNPFRYRSYIYDQETHLYYLQSRYYNPEWGRFLNADALVSTGQGFSGYNMFAYCNNNPVKLVDFGGNIPREFFAISTYGGGGFARASTASAKEIQTVIAAAGAAVIAGKFAEKAAKRNNSVYVLRDDIGTVQYVGRTNDIDRRRAAHSMNPARANLRMEVVASGLTLQEARALEQAGMLYHHTINTANKMNNQINSVAPKYWGAYKDIARGVLDYGWNQMTNEILYWTGN